MPGKNTFRKHRPLFAHQLPKPEKKPAKKKWVILPVLWRSFKRTCFALGLMMMISMVFWGVTLSRLSSQTAPPSLPPEMVVYLKLEGQVSEHQQMSPFANPFAPVAPTLRTMVETLERAGTDDRVKGLMVRLSDVSMSLSQIQELRAAIKDFRETGKFAYIYASSYGGGTGGLGRLYLASAFDQRWMQPLGVVSMAGMRVEMPFFKNVLDKIGVVPDFFQRKEYKTAYESLTNKEMSAANRESMKAVVEAMRDAISADMPSDLGMEAEAFDDYIDYGLFTAPEALDRNLVTHLDYVDVLIDTVKEQVTGSASADDSLFVHFDAYAQDLTRRAENVAMHKKKRVALIYVSGAIVETSQGQDNIAAADIIAPAILDAADDKSIEAIILRIDSPGGSPVASESILRAMHKAQAKGKKVIVSMGTVAASGGYWIASGADYIFAMPTTLTGSIGVLGGKFSAGPMWDKLGVNWDRSIQWGDNAGIWSFNETFTPDQKLRIDAMLDQIYTAFIERVSKGRGLTPKQTERIARGRVWPGLNAYENGLVDELGGLKDAVAYTAAALDLDDPSDLKLVQMPKELSPLEQIAKLLGQRSIIFETLRMQSTIGQLLAPIAREADTLSMMRDPEMMVYTPVRGAR